MMFSTLDLLALSEIPGIGSKTVIKAFDLSREFSFQSILDIDWMDARYDSKKLGKAILELEKSKGLTLQELIACAADKIDVHAGNGVTVISIADHEYSKPLSLIPDPPPLLYAVGKMSAFNSRCAAVVGTRKPSVRGTAITRRTTSFLASNGVTIVSGLAIGVDSIAHQAAVDLAAPSIGVLVDIKNIHPAINRALATKILEFDGVLCSENPPGTIATRGLFVKRDRIQSGLSQITFVIEASKASGSMHAGRAALAMGRDLYIPDTSKAGYDDSAVEQLQGVRELASDGAIPYCNTDYPTILERLDLAFQANQS